MKGVEKNIDNKDEHLKVENILNNIRIAVNKDVNKIETRTLNNEIIELQQFKNGSSIVYKDNEGYLTKVIDVDLNDIVLRLRLFNKGTLYEAYKFDNEGDFTQLAIWNNGILAELYNLRKDKTNGKIIESQALFVDIVDIEKCLARYEITVNDKNGKFKEKHNEIEEIEYSEDMNVWMLKNNEAKMLSRTLFDTLCLKGEF